MASESTPTESGSTPFISYCSGLSCAGGWAVHGTAAQKCEVLSAAWNCDDSLRRGVKKAVNGSS
jgi:hypothetical protein